MIKCSKEQYIQKVPEGFRKWGDASVDEGIQLPNDSLSASKCIFIANPHPSCDIFTLFSFVLSPEEPAKHAAEAKSSFKLPAFWTQDPALNKETEFSVGTPH